MHRYVPLAIGVMLAASLMAPQAAQAATGPARTYQVTITKFELNNGTSWVTVSSGNSTTIDIAAVNAGAVAGTFFSGLSVPDGTYTQVRVTISPTFTISGNVGANYTTATLSNGVCVTTTTAASEAACTMSVPGGLPAPTPDNLPTTLTVTNGVPSHKIRVTFNVNNAITDDNAPPGTAIPGNPTVTMAMVAL